MRTSCPTSSFPDWTQTTAATARNVDCPLVRRDLKAYPERVHYPLALVSYTVVGKTQYVIRMALPHGERTHRNSAQCSPVSSRNQLYGIRA